MTAAKFREKYFREWGNNHENLELYGSYKNKFCCCVRIYIPNANRKGSCWDVKWNTRTNTLFHMKDDPLHAFMYSVSQQPNIILETACSFYLQPEFLLAIKL